MYIGILIDQPVADLANETHTTANYIHMVISIIWSGPHHH